MQVTIRVVDIATASTTDFTLDLPTGASVGDLARLVKQRHPLEFRDVPAARLKVFSLAKNGHYCTRSVFSCRLPMFMARAWEEPWSIPHETDEYAMLDMNAKLEDQLPPATEKDCEVTHVTVLPPMKSISCYYEDMDEVSFVGIHESRRILDLKVYLMKTRCMPVFKLVLARDVSQPLMCAEMAVEGRSEHVTNRLRELAARDEMDLSKTVRSVFGDITTWLDLDILIVPYKSVLGKRNEPSVGDNDDSQRQVNPCGVLQSVQLLPLGGLQDVMEQITDFVGLPRSIDLPVREGWIQIVRAFGDSTLCSLDAMDEAAANGHLEVVKWLHEHHPEWNTNYGLLGAVRNDHVEVVNWLVEFGRDWDFNWEFYMQPGSCSEEMLKHLEKTRDAVPDLMTSPIVEASKAGRLDEVKHLKSECSPFEIKVAMAEAARSDQLEVVKFFLNEFHAYSTRLAVETAAAAGRTHVLDLLLRTKPEQLVMVAMESAARHNRLDVLAYFGKDDDSPVDEHPSAMVDELYCASNALDEAARAGHKDAVRWILDTLMITSTTFDVIAKAVRDDRYDVVRLLCSCATDDEIFMTLFRGVSVRGNLKAIQAIYECSTPDKVAGSASNLLSRCLCDQATRDFLRSVEHIGAVE